MVPVATVSTASSDHIRIAVSPINVAVRGVILDRGHFRGREETERTRNFETSGSTRKTAWSRNDGVSPQYIARR